MIKDERDPKLQYELDRATEQAFVSVSRKLRVQSDLEILPQKKQATIAKHTDKLSKLKARVQQIVGNVDDGIHDLEDITTTLKRLRKDMEEIKSQCTEVTANMPRYQETRDLARILGRLYKVSELQRRFTEAEQQMADVDHFCTTYPGDISIQCYKIVTQLLDFEAELLENLKNETQKTFIRDKFQPVQEAMQTLQFNAQKIVMAAFKTPDDETPKITTDKLARAVWIVIASSIRLKQPLTVKDLLTDSIAYQFKNANTALSVSQLDSLLKKLQDVLENITDTLDIIIPALPSPQESVQGIQIMDILGQLANAEVLKVIDKIVNNSTSSTFLLSRIIIWMRDYIGSMGHMLGVEPSDEMKKRLITYEERLESQIPEDLHQFLSNIIAMEPDAIDTNRDGTISTQAPYDFMKRLIDADKVAIETNLPGNLPNIRAGLLRMFIMDTQALGEFVQESPNRRYVMAAINNSLSGIRTCTDLGQKLPEVVDAASIMTLKNKWATMQKNAMSHLNDMIITEIAAADEWDLRNNFGQKLEQAQQACDEAKTCLLGPLFRKFISQFLHQFIAYYIISYKQPTQLTLEQFTDNIDSDKNMMIDWLMQYESNQWSKNLMQVLESLKKIVTESDGFMKLDYGGIVEVYKDFTPQLMEQLVKMSPKGTSISSDIMKGIVNKYDSVKAEADNGERYISPVIDRFPDKRKNILNINLKNIASRD